MSCASLAPIMPPPVTISSALGTPATRGRRWVPPAPGSRPSLTSGTPSFADGHRDAIMAAERDLEPAAERGAVDRGDHRLGAILDPVDHFGQPRHHRRLAEFGDVGAGEEGLPFAADDDRLDRVVALGLLDRRDQPLAHRRAERVDRRVVGGDDEDVAVAAGSKSGWWSWLVDHVGHDRGPAVALVVERVRGAEGRRRRPAHGR